MRVGEIRARILGELGPAPTEFVRDNATNLLAYAGWTGIGTPAGAARQLMRTWPRLTRPEAEWLGELAYKVRDNLLIEGAGLLAYEAEDMLRDGAMSEASLAALSEGDRRLVRTVMMRLGITSLPNADSASAAARGVD